MERFINWFVNPNITSNTDGIVAFIVLSLVGLIRPFMNQHGMRAGFRVMIAANSIFYGLYQNKI